MPKKPERNPLHEEMQPGEARVIYCNSCSTEFKIVLEPKLEQARTPEERKQGGEAKRPEFLECMFCGESTDLELYD